MNKIISFSLWGDKPIYNIGAIKNLKLAKTEDLMTIKGINDKIANLIKQNIK